MALPPLIFFFSFLCYTFHTIAPSYYRMSTCSLGEVICSYGTYLARGITTVLCSLSICCLNGDEWSERLLLSAGFILNINSLIVSPLT